MPDPLVLKKYSNRRLYDTRNSRYVTLEDVAQMIRSGEQVRIKDVATGDDVTAFILTQIVLEAARRMQRTPLSVAANWRERRTILGFWGVKCRQCGTPQYDYGGLSTSPIRVCGVCGAQDDFDEYSFVRKKATVFSYTQDNLAPSPDPPSSVVMVEFEGGGRAMFDLTDRDPSEVKVGMEVEMTFRKVYVDQGLTSYFWKARPTRF